MVDAGDGQHPGGQMRVGRRADAGIAWRILLATLTGFLVLGIVGGIAVNWYFSDSFFSSEWRGLLVIGIVCLGAAVVVLAVGLWSARQVGRGRWGRRRRCTACGRLAGERLERCPFCGADLLRAGGHGGGPAWRVAAPGADLARAIDGETVGPLPQGTVVTEVRRIESQVFVVAADGRTGWVGKDRLEPLPEGGTGRRQAEV